MEEARECFNFETREIFNLTQDEFNVAMEALNKYWDEQEKERYIQKQRVTLQLLLDECLEVLGLAETKALYREIKKGLYKIEEAD